MFGALCSSGCAVGDTPAITAAFERLRPHLGNDDSHALISALPTPLPAGTPVSNSLRSFSAEVDAWFFFVDDVPFANWAHDCRYGSLLGCAPCGLTSRIRNRGAMPPAFLGGEGVVGVSY